MTRTIGGRLDMAGYERPTQKHRPTDQTAMAAEVRRLHQTGHSIHYIAAALRLAPEAVINMLTTTGDTP